MGPIGFQMELGETEEEEDDDDPYVDAAGVV
jgi:hypothetical protein